MTDHLSTIRGWEFFALALGFVAWGVARVRDARRRRLPILTWPVRGPWLAAMTWLGIASLSLNSWLTYLGHAPWPLLSWPACCHLGVVIVLIYWAWLRWRRRGLED